MGKLVQKGVTEQVACNFMKKNNWGINEIRMRVAEGNITYFYKNEKKIGYYDKTIQSLFKC